MKYGFIFAMLMCGVCGGAYASIPYRVLDNTSHSSNEVFAWKHPVYIAGAYNYSMWQSYTDSKDVKVNGKNTSSFDVSLGLRIVDTFRVEANYIRTDADWRDFSMTGNTMMLNAIFDARIDSPYRLFHKQYLVPYIGLGAGASWNKATDIDIVQKMSPVVAGLAGLSIEFGEHFAFDFGYRYMYMFSPKFAGIDNLRPVAHQFRGGVRLNF
ncbi:MAG: outer membrane protein [Alphaproteobacteria bacterium]